MKNGLVMAIQHFVIVHWRKTNILELVERIGGGEIGLCCNSKSQDVDPNDVRASDVLNEERQQMANPNIIRIH